MIDCKVGIIGVGFVGGAILKSFKQNKNKSRGARCVLV